MSKTLALSFACAAMLFAQDFRATLSGTVTDPTGAAVPGATVKAVKASTNETKETITNSQGIYNIPFLDPGDYAVTVTAQGFSELKRTGISLRVADKKNLPLTLDLGNQASTVTVNAEIELIC